ncbi:monovalent cation/H+ antiporter complex subunit F [Anaerotignum sp.]|uniref:monovalent cation/H+ antiporter complex subunit F n=1 Tax=Anaerotignum sp. TaxID=2039241 RepID=UPI0028A893F9|nr:monovalent cation/H+ antiporter complex subunit F [Anaerotignum sp.]
MSAGLKLLLEISLAFFAIGICIVFIRAIRGPRFTDRIMAINMIGTMTTAVICILSIYLNEVWLIDVALVYTLLSFLAVVIICHVVTLHHNGRMLFLSKKEKEEKEE